MEPTRLGRMLERVLVWAGDGLPAPLTDPQPYRRGSSGRLHRRDCDSERGEDVELGVWEVYRACRGAGEEPARCCGTELALPTREAELALRELDEALRCAEAVERAVRAGQEVCAGRFAGRGFELVAEAWEILARCEAGGELARYGGVRSEQALTVLTSTRARLLEASAELSSGELELAQDACRVRLAVLREEARLGQPLGRGSPVWAAGEAGASTRCVEELAGVLRELGAPRADPAAVLSELRGWAGQLRGRGAGDGWLLAGAGLARIERAVALAEGAVIPPEGGLREVPGRLGACLGESEGCVFTPLTSEERMLSPQERGELCELTAALLGGSGAETAGLDAGELRGWIDAARASLAVAPLRGAPAGACGG